MHLESGRVYHVEFNPPTQENRDDVTGEELIQREDDKEGTVRKRLAVYHEQTEPLVDFYQQREAAGQPVKVIKISGVASVDSIKDEILTSLS